MNAQDSTRVPNQPAGKNPKWMLILAVVFVAILAAISVNWILPPRWRPQLDITNTGQNAVTLSINGDTLVIEPGRNGSMRFSAGDNLSIRAAEAMDPPTITVALQSATLSRGL